jgi:ABC-type branched-subunit amino acid transport system ATPase component/ABC-type branched-subunit amino acid transport system permease subunit
MSVLAFVVPGTHFVVTKEIVVLGLVHGLSYSLIGLGLLLVYKSTRVLNFAQGEIGAVGAGLIPLLVLAHHVNYWLALPLALLVSTALGGVTEVILRRLRHAPRLVLLVATIGLSQAYYSLFVVLSTIGMKQPIFRGTYPVPIRAVLDVGRLRLTPGDLLMVGCVPVIVVLLAIFLKYTKVGLQSRAAAENYDAACLGGIRVPKVSFAVWAIAGLLAGISAVLLGPTRPVFVAEPLGPSLLVRGIAAAMIGGLSSFPGVFAGGLLIGVIEALFTFNYPTSGVLDLVIFLLIAVSLLVRRQLRSAARGGEERAEAMVVSDRHLDRRVARLPAVRLANAALIVVGLGAAAAIPMFMSNGNRVLATGTLLFAMVGLSLVLLVGYAGQVSLGQFALVGIGAAVGANMARLGQPKVVAIVVAVAAGGVAALVIGVPALRIRGLFLAVVTLAFALATQTWLFNQRWLVPTGAEEHLVRSRWFGLDTSRELNYFWLNLIFFVVAAVVVHHVRRTGVGRSMLAIRDNEPAAATIGISPTVRKLQSFILSGMIAALAGYLYGGLLVRFTSSSTFTPDLSLTVLAMVIVGGASTVTGAIVGAMWVQGVSQFIAPLFPPAAQGVVDLLVAGPGVVAVLLFMPGGISEKLFDIRDGVVRRYLRSRPDTRALEQEVFRAGELVLATGAVEPGTDVPVPSLSPDGPGPPPELIPLGSVTSRRPGLRAAHPPATATVAALEARRIRVNFGGIRALTDVSMFAMPGEVVALVGPNGAGKTTLFDALSGQLRPAAGTTILHGHDITRLRPEARARLGMSRTFQQALLFRDLTVSEVFKAASECETPSRIVPSVLGLPSARKAERKRQAEADDIIDLLGLQTFAHRRVAELSTGTRRIVELGCAVAVGGDVLLLDEPSSGVAQRNMATLQQLLADVRRHLHATLVIIEHNIPLVAGLADRVYVLASGEVLVQGPPSVLRDDKRVVEAYLGHRRGVAVPAASPTGVISDRGEETL